VGSGLPLSPRAGLDAPASSRGLGADTAPADSQGSRLIVGPEVKLKGAEISDCDTLVVEGRVEATLDSRLIQISERGSFAGKVSIDVAEIRGRFEGELTARKQLVIHSGGRVSGIIRYGKIVIEEGGEVTGDVRSILAEARGSASSSDLVDLASVSKAAVVG
jgi:cytoskeletal protein CcmA (bactofilin family)